MEPENLTSSASSAFGKSTQMHTLYTDGSAQPNPGPCGCGAVLLDPNQKILWTTSEYLGPNGTNNIGELTAILRGLTRCTELQIQKLDVFSDSELSVDILNGKKETKKEHLLQIVTRIRALLTAHPTLHVTFQWIKAHNNHTFNEMADGLASQALTTQLPPPPASNNNDDDFAFTMDDPPPAPKKQFKPAELPANPLFIKCPFAEKDAVKKLGARWSSDKKSWYTEDTLENRTKYAKWL